MASLHCCGAWSMYVCFVDIRVLSSFNVVDSEVETSEASSDFAHPWVCCPWFAFGSSSRAFVLMCFFVCLLPSPAKWCYGKSHKVLEQVCNDTSKPPLMASPCCLSCWFDISCRGPFNIWFLLTASCLCQLACNSASNPSCFIPSFTGQVMLWLILIRWRSCIAVMFSQLPLMAISLETTFTRNP